MGIPLEYSHRQFGMTGIVARECNMFVFAMIGQILLLRQLQGTNQCNVKYKPSKGIDPHKVHCLIANKKKIITNSHSLKKITKIMWTEYIS